MRSWILPALVLGGGAAVAWFATRPSSASSAPSTDATGEQQPEIEVIPGVGAMTIPGIPWYVRSPEDVAALVRLEAARVAAGGRLNVRPTASCAGDSCG